MICDSCFHKEICAHFINIKNGTYGYARNNFDIDKCKHYVFVEEKKIDFNIKRYVRTDKITDYLKRLKWAGFISAETAAILGAYMDMHTELIPYGEMDGDKK